MIYRFLIIAATILFGSTLQAQVIREFSTDSIKFIDELQIQFEKINLKENQEEALLAHQQFKELWVAEIFDHQQKQIIYAITNQMLERRVKTFPDFMVFFQELVSFHEHAHPEKSFNAWLSGMFDLLANSRNNRSFTTYLDFTHNLLEKNVLYDSRAFIWKINTGLYRFESDSLLYMLVPDCDLTCFTSNDSSIIFKTSGKYYPADFSWRGTGGRIDWRRAQLDPNTVYALLDHYTISTKSLKYEVDSVNFFYKDYFPDALPGKLEEKVSPNSTRPGNVSYPQFTSYLESHFISNIFRNIDFQGGFSLKGVKIIGTGTRYADAMVIFKKRYQEKSELYDLLVARSKSFVINSNRINASNAAVSVYHHTDSIFHSGLMLKYLDSDRELSLLRIDEGIVQSPYFDTYHDVEIDCEAVYWDMDNSTIDFRSTKGIQNTNTALFYSDKLYSERQFDHLQGLSFKHPLIWINDYSKVYQTREFFVYEMAQYLKKPENQIESLVIDLAKKGFLYYDIDTKKAFINDKVSHFIDAKNGMTDYDVISFYSEVEGYDNATLNLDNFDLTIRGVPFVSISDSQKVYIYPSNEEVILRKNKDFLFSGKIKAGMFEFFASDCSFEYDSFRLNLPTIDRMNFKARPFEPDPDEPGKLVDVKTVISNISGDLKIDHPNNKNGLLNYPGYPEFNSKTDSYVYYDRDTTLTEAYDRKRFYYHLYPFTIEGLEDFSTDSLQFDGCLHSGGIFPDIEYPLKVQRDYSLGFVYQIPEKGFDIYSGNGKYYRELSLNNSGLKGKGKLDALNSVTSSNDFIFYLDSANAFADKFEIQKIRTQNVSLPSVSGKLLHQHWLPYQDSMMVASTDSLIKLYDGTATLRGSLTLTPDRLDGSGRTWFHNATMNAGYYAFADHSFITDTADFRLNTPEGVNLVYAGNLSSSRMDFDHHIGSFNVMETTKVDFPVNKFICFMDEFDWLISSNDLEFRSNNRSDTEDWSQLAYQELIGKKLPGSLFVSTHSSLDSLEFRAGNASYNLDAKIIEAHDVKLINVADAAIFPGDEIVRVGENSSVHQLFEATIIADTSNKFHRIDNATVNIQSKKSYKASGLYAYTSPLLEPQYIQFEDIRVDTGYHTRAEGVIPEGQNFRLNPYFQYKGDIALNAESPSLQFDGAYKIIQDCNPDFSRWVKSYPVVNPDSVVLPVGADPQEYGYKNLYAAFFHSNENNKVYPAFLSRKEYYSDTMMFNVNGMITNRRKGNEFIIASPEVLSAGENMAPASRYMALNTKDYEVTANGEVRFGADLRQVKLQTFGTIKHLIVPDSTLFDLAMLVDFYFSNEAFTLMHEGLLLANAKGVDPTNHKMQTTFTGILGEDMANELISDLNLYGSLRTVPEGIKTSLLFSDLKMVYNKERRSFISVGKIGVGSINGESVNKSFDGFVEVVRKRSGDALNIYIEITRRHWFFFSYSRNVMQAISSQSDFNKILRDVKVSKR
nr:hypothetical protein [Bacteroidota bacterium]